MKRLTEKDKYGHFYTNQANCRNIWSSDGKKLEGEYFENKTLAIDGKAIDKLGQLEDIEEEFGIDLIALLKAKKIHYFDIYYDRVIDSNYYIIDVKLKQLQVENDYGVFINLDFSEYGITWALTKEELEK